MQEARYWESGEKVQCLLCPHNCKIAEDGMGKCRSRKVKEGKLYTLNYDKAVALNVDPVEKKPIYHFQPGTLSLSIGTAGCNLFCEHCQNNELSNAKAGELQELDLPPEVIVQLAIDKGCHSISYTYNEPTIFHEYATDIARLAKQKGLKNIIVTNGFINKKPAEEFCEVMDAANVDLKAFNESFYNHVCKSRLEPVKEAIKTYNSIWLEITNLIIDGKNDNLQEIEQMCKWIKDNVGKHVPLHFSRAFPMHKMQDIKPTPEDTLLKAKEIAKKYLDYVYIGNFQIEDGQNTYCPECGKLLIDRERGGSINISDSLCECGQKIPGVWE